MAAPGRYGWPTAAAVVIPACLRHHRRPSLQVGSTTFVPMVVLDLGVARAQCQHDDDHRDPAPRNPGRHAPGGDPAALIAAGATLAVLAGAMLFLAAVLRLGFVANFISEPVLTGFKSGIGLVIVVDQIPKLLGVHIHKEGFFRDLIAIAGQIPHVSLLTLVLSRCSCCSSSKPLEQTPRARCRRDRRRHPRIGAVRAEQRRR
jgi:MFS superfamily sulfate permease-like transporter